MAETNDIQAHYRSLQVEPNSVPLLNGQRYNLNFYRNQQYQIPQSNWDAILKDLEAGNNESLVELAQYLTNDHYVWQLPRILTLERYYQGDANIHYWQSNKKNRADNRIAGGLPRYITNFGVGYQFGNDLAFNYDDGTDDSSDSADVGQDLLDSITDFNNANDESYHEKTMAINVWNTGRSYELLYVPAGSTSPKMATIDPSQAFVVYNTDIDKQPIFAIRYYFVKVMDQEFYNIEIYTDDTIYYFKAEGKPGESWTFQSKDNHYFGKVPLNEIDANDERVGKWEPHLDKIDARDKSLSEMANSQEDFSNATLVIAGDVNDLKKEVLQTNDGHDVYVDDITGEYVTNSFSYDNDGNKHDNALAVVDHSFDTKSNILVLKPSKIFTTDGQVQLSQTSAEYLTKQLDANEWQMYIQQLTSDIHKETFTPDVSDESFAGNASGVAMAYKLMGSDQERVITETLYRRGIMRRLRLLCNYWNNLPKSSVHFNAADDADNPANNVTIKFTPNLPKNEQELIDNLVSLHNTGELSSETFLQLAAPVTGVPASQEQERLDSEQSQSTNQQAQTMAALYAQQFKLNTGEVPANNASTDDGSNTTGNASGDSSTDDGAGDDNDNNS